MLKRTVKICHVCSYMFRSNWTILREPMPSLAKVTILWNFSVKIHHYTFSRVVVKNVSSCGVYWVPCSVWMSHTARHTIHTTPWNNFHHNTAELITMYFYWLIPQNCNFSKVWHRLPEDGPIGPKHVGVNMTYFNCTF